MKLTAKSECSILALIYIARNEKRGYIKVEEISSRRDIPRKYLELLFTVLRQNRYIRTKRGTRGGYKLARPASRLSVGRQQRLCLARGLAVEPKIILADGPTSALDHKSSQRIEAIFANLVENFTVIIVTGILRQAR